MGLFKSKEEKEMEQRMLIKKTMSNITKYITGLETQKDKYIDAAKKAKLKGSSSQYNLALSGLKTAMAQQKKAEEMLLNFELTSQMRDLTKMTSNFLGGMSVISKEMAKITNDMDFVKVQKEFEKAMLGVESTTENLDVLLDTSNMSFESIANTSSKVANEEIEKLIDNDLSNDEKELDSDLEAKMAEIKKSLKDI